MIQLGNLKSNITNTTAKVFNRIVPNSMNCSAKEKIMPHFLGGNSNKLSREENHTKHKLNLYA